MLFSPYPIVDSRELILQRIQDVLKTVSPSTTFTFPDGMTHAPITNDLGGRVYSKMRGAVAVDAVECPYVEMITSAKTPDKITSQSDDWYTATMAVQFWLYAKGDDSGDGLDSIIRPLLNSLCADVSIGIEAVPYWGPSPNPPFDTLQVIFGPRLSFDLKTRWTRPAIQSAGGFAYLEYDIAFPFLKRFP